MAKEESQAQEQKYFELLNISVLSISKIKNLIKQDIIDTLFSWKQGKEIDRQCFHIIGPAGVGKTQICDQIREELSDELKVSFEMIMVKSPVLSRDDFIIPFPIIDNGNTSFKMLYSDFVPKDPDSYGLFVIDEAARGDHSLQQLLWQVENEYKIHLMDFPKGWFVITIDNPDDSEYQMDTMEDAAGLRRMLHIYTEVSTPDFLNYAIQKDFHKFVIEFIQTHPDLLYDFDSQKRGAVYANPASWEKLSDHLWKMELHTGIDKNFARLDSIASGLLNVSMSQMFMEFIKEGKDINPKDIFEDYIKVRPRIKKLLKENDNATLGNVMMGFITFLTTSKPAYNKKEIKNVATFLTDIPLDTAAVFVTGIDSFDRASSEFKYVTTLHVELMNNPNYKTLFYEAVVKCGKEEK